MIIKILSYFSFEILKSPCQSQAQGGIDHYNIENRIHNSYIFELKRINCSLVSGVQKSTNFSTKINLEFIQIFIMK